jgi:hypothetical protein
MGRTLWLCIVLSLVLGAPRGLPAAEEGQDNLDKFAGIFRPTLELGFDVVADTVFSLGREALIFPFRLLDLAFYPPSYYWNYDTGDFWSATRRRAIVPPEIRELPAMRRTQKAGAPPRLLNDSLYIDADAYADLDQ